MSFDDPHQRLADIDQQMETISDLDSLGRALNSALGILIAAITTDDLDPRVVLQPRREGVGRSLGQEVYHPAAFQVAENRAVVLTLLPGPIVHATPSNLG
jgi:hypothetical protein